MKNAEVYFAPKLSNEIDVINNKFINEMKSRLRNLDKFSEAGLDWLMAEHYQFSFRNTSFLATAANTTAQFKNKNIELELQRNLKEETTHAAIYKKALAQMGTDVEKRIEFSPTTEFFNKIQALIITCPSTTVGAMYATETAAIFEHEVFSDIACEVAKRRNLAWEGSNLKRFHDMHLGGVEQSHKDELGVFVDINDETNINGEVDKSKVLLGANQAIEAMVVWWNALLEKTESL